MITIRKSIERGKSYLGWLDSNHTFSFADYFDPQFMGFSHLRVINEDTVQAGQGFGQHPHKNMEIISYVIDGELAHKDSLGNGSIIKTGEIQRMSAGTGITHSEFNPSDIDTLHFLQIWIIPESVGITPSYEQKTIEKSENKLILIGSQDQNLGAVTIHQDVKLFVAYLTKGATLSYDFKKDRSGWVQLVRGQISLDDESVLIPGDGAGITRAKKMTITCINDAELLFFDLS